MRLKKHFYACICMLLIGIGSLQAKEVTLTEAGTLSGMISNEELNSLTELTVNGPVNGSDIKIIRAMGGTLKTLNMKNARIVEGGDSYYLTDKFTQNDVIGDYMFYAMTAMEKIVMPKMCGLLVPGIIIILGMRTRQSFRDIPQATIHRIIIMTISVARLFTSASISER